jgi:hypothetical protein
VYAGLALAIFAALVLWRIGLGKVLYVIVDVIFLALLDGARPDRRDW